MHSPRASGPRWLIRDNASSREEEFSGANPVRTTEPTMPHITAPRLELDTKKNLAKEASNILSHFVLDQSRLPEYGHQD